MLHVNMDFDKTKKSFSKPYQKYQKTSTFTKTPPVFATPYKKDWKQNYSKPMNESQVIEISDDEGASGMSQGADELDEIYNNLIDAIDQIIDIKLRQYNKPFGSVVNNK